MAALWSGVEFVASC